MAGERDDAAGPAVLLEALEDARLLAGEPLGREGRIRFLNGRVGHFVQQRAPDRAPARFTRRRNPARPDAGRHRGTAR